jgi:hypothetical protein
MVPLMTVRYSRIDIPGVFRSISENPWISSNISQNPEKFKASMKLKEMLTQLTIEIR